MVFEPTAFDPMILDPRAWHAALQWLASAFVMVALGATFGAVPVHGFLLSLDLPRRRVPVAPRPAPLMAVIAVPSVQQQPAARILPFPDLRRIHGSVRARRGLSSGALSSGTMPSGL